MIGLKTRVVARRFQVQLAAINRSTAEGRRSALVAGTKLIMEKLFEDCPVDTGRMIRGYELAANSAGLGPYPVTPVGPSKYDEVNKALLGDQVAGVRDVYRSVRRMRMAYEKYNRDILKGRGKNKVGRGRQSPYYRKLVADEARWHKALKQAIAQKLEVGPTSIVMYNKGRKVAYTVRNKIYGGDGEIIETARRASCRITNREPHAIVQERSSAVIAPALVWARGAGSRHIASAYLNAMSDAASDNVKRRRA